MQSDLRNLTAWAIYPWEVSFSARSTSINCRIDFKTGASFRYDTAGFPMAGHARRYQRLRLWTRVRKLPVRLAMLPLP